MQRLSHKYQLRLINEISITPLLDVVLVLLFVFMLAAPLWNGDGELKLPSAGGAKSELPNEVVPLTIDSTQTLRLNDKPVAQADLVKELKALVHDKPAAGVLVKIHRDLPVQFLVDVMDSLRQADVRKTAVATLNPGSK
jgi:biopolymer transport protein ExbD